MISAAKDGVTTVQKFCLKAINIRALNNLQTARQRNIKIAKAIWSSGKSTKVKVCSNSSLIPCPPTTSSRMTANCVDKLDHIIMQFPDCTEFLVLVVLIHLRHGKHRLSGFSSLLQWLGSGWCWKPLSMPSSALF